MTNLAESAKEVLKSSTPGPWVAENYAHHTKIACVGGFVIEDYGYEGLALARFNDVEDGANLHLMALAPDLARAVLAAEALADAVARRKDPGATYSTIEIRLENALAAYRAATGGQP